MEAKVDHDLCIGCALCESICPELYEIREDDLAHELGTETEYLQDSAEEARDACPTEAITIE